MQVNITTPTILEDSLKWWEIERKIEEILDAGIDDVARLLKAKGKFISYNFCELYSSARSYTLNSVLKQSKSFKEVLRTKNTKKILEWIFERQCSNLLNCATDPAYRGYQPTPFVVNFDNCYQKMSNNEEEIEKEILQEEIKKLPKEKIIEALKKVWEEAKYTEGFDAKDIKELCEKYDINIYDVISRQEFQAPNIVKKTDPKTGREYLYFSDLLD